MRADKLCLNCEWWETRWIPEGGDWATEKASCLRWPGRAMMGDERCWQHAKRMEESEILSEDLERIADITSPLDLVRVRRVVAVDQEKDLRNAARLVLEAGLTTGSADTCVDLVSEVLRQVKELQDLIPRLNLRIQLAQALIEQANPPVEGWPDWPKDADAWLQED